MGGKQTITMYNRAWAEWLLQAQQVEVEAELSGEFQFIARATDSLLQVKGQTGHFLVLSELQFRYDQQMPNRLSIYAGLARQKYSLDVFVTVVYLLPPAAGTVIVDAFHREFMGQVAHQDFRVIALWELEAEQVLAFNNPVLLPFVPLMRGGNTEQVVRRCVERIRQEPEALELETILAVFAGYVLDTKLIKQILRWEMEIVNESPIIQELLTQRWQSGFAEGLEEGLEKGREEGLEKGLEKGREEGREEGEREAMVKALHQTLTIRFGIALGEFDEQIKLLNLKSLEQLNRVALIAQTPVEFEKALAEMLANNSAAS